MFVHSRDQKSKTKEGQEKGQEKERKKRIGIGWKENPNNFLEGEGKTKKLELYTPLAQFFK